MDIKAALAHVVQGNSLSRADMQAVMTSIMTGAATDAQIGAFLVALRMKGETVDEITAAAQVMRDLSKKVDVSADYLVDTCGTGGDGANLFNVSTASAFVVAAAGGHVAKHGNRSVSSSTGSADVLEAAGVNLNLDAEHVARCVEELGVGFMFAPAHHGAMKHAIGPRKELAMRTIFNMLGPMTNPAGVKHQIIGVYDNTLCRIMAEVLQQLGSEHVMVVHSDDGLDELSIAAPSHVAELKNGQITEYTIKPEDYGLQADSLDGLGVESAEDSLALIKLALRKGGAEDETEREQKARNIILLNAGAAIYVSGLALTLADGIECAADAIGCGLAAAKVSELGAFTKIFA